MFATGGMAGIAAIVPLVPALGALTTTPKAWAITRNADGTLTVTFHQVAQLSGLNAKFASMGLPIKAIPITPNCHSSVLVPMDFMSPDVVAGDSSMAGKVVLGTDYTRGQHEVIAARQLPSGQVEMQIITIDSGGVPTCLTR